MNTVYLSVNLETDKIIRISPYRELLADESEVIVTVTLTAEDIKRIVQVS